MPGGSRKLPDWKRHCSEGHRQGLCSTCKPFLLSLALEVRYRIADRGGKDVQVNETQPIYVGPQAQLRFNPPGVKVSRNSRNATFTLQPNPIPAPPGYAAFVFSGVGRASGYLACPLAEKGIWQVFADLARIKDSWIPSGDKSDCIGFDAFATNYTSPVPAAYQYV